MIVQCKGCKTRFRLADEKIGPKGARVRCIRCNATFQVSREEKIKFEASVKAAQNWIPDAEKGAESNSGNWSPDADAFWEDPSFLKSGKTGARSPLDEIGDIFRGIAQPSSSSGQQSPSPIDSAFSGTADLPMDNPPESVVQWSTGEDDPLMSDADVGDVLAALESVSDLFEEGSEEEVPGLISGEEAISIGVFPEESQSSDFSLELDRSSDLSEDVQGPSLPGLMDNLGFIADDSQGGQDKKKAEYSQVGNKGSRQIAKVSGRKEISAKKSRPVTGTGKEAGKVDSSYDGREISRGSARKKLFDSMSKDSEILESENVLENNELEFSQQEIEQEAPARKKLNKATKTARQKTQKKSGVSISSREKSTQKPHAGRGSDHLKKDPEKVSELDVKELFEGRDVAEWSMIAGGANTGNIGDISIDDAVSSGADAGVFSQEDEEDGEIASGFLTSAFKTSSGADSEKIDLTGSLHVPEGKPDKLSRSHRFMALLKASLARFPHLSTAANALFIAATLTMAFFMFVLAATGPPIDMSLLSKERIENAISTLSSPDSPVTDIVSAGKYINSSGEPILYIRGLIVNMSDTEADLKEYNLLGFVKDAGAEIIRSSTAIIGNLPTPEDIWRLSDSTDLAQLRIRLSEKAMSEYILPGESIDFIVLFVGIEKEPYSLRFETSLDYRGSKRAEFSDTEIDR